MGTVTTMQNNLKEYLDKASAAYYNGSPIISDETFDRLADSINYNEVGAKVSANEEKHLYRMYSQQKYYEGEGNKKPLENYHTKVSPKFDGAAIECLYVNGRFTRAMTRGDGIKGQVITHLINARPDLVPMTIPTNEPTQISFEAVAPANMENSRNYASGAINLKDPEEFKTRAITLLAYGVFPFPTENYSTDIITLQRWGFNTVKDKNLTEIYPTDGIIFRVESNKEFVELGYTSKFPHGSYALKTRTEAVETVLLDVEWTTSKSGRVNPVAILEPVKIGDALISRATLNNIAFIEALDLRIGSIVQVIRSGEIIPCIVGKSE
jgi:NAD-dependent DNA ligase